MKTRYGKMKAGFTLVEIMIVVAILGLLAAIAIPNFVQARLQSQKNECLKNLAKIEKAKAEWAKANPEKTDVEPIWLNISRFYADGATNAPYCPAASEHHKNFLDSYKIGKAGSPPSCQIDPNHIYPPKSAPSATASK